MTQDDRRDKRAHTESGGDARGAVVAGGQEILCKLERAAQWEMSDVTGLRKWTCNEKGAVGWKNKHGWVEWRCGDVGLREDQQ